MLLARENVDSPLAAMVLATETAQIPTTLGVLCSVHQNGHVIRVYPGPRSGQRLSPIFLLDISTLTRES